LLEIKNLQLLLTFADTSDLSPEITMPANKFESKCGLHIMELSEIQVETWHADF